MELGNLAFVKLLGIRIGLAKSLLFLGNNQRKVYFSFLN